jgi:hypothetical protein
VKHELQVEEDIEVAINWTTVETQIAQAVAGIVGPAWQNAATGASTQFAAIIAAGKQIEADRNSMQQAEYDSLKLMQQRALEGVLQTYEGISLDIAQRAAAAAWNVIVNALTSAATRLVL